ncbi:MAG: hypothetical protein V1729_02485 [Candidatus Woesearchaeota archaeon]
MKKRALVPTLLIAIFLLSSIAAYAQVVTPTTFFVTIDYVSDKIANPAKDYADLYVVVENKGSEKDTYKLLYLDDPKWSYQVLPEPINKQITIAPGETGEFHLLVKGNVAPGFYGVKVSVHSEKSGNTISNVMRLRVGAQEPKIPSKPDFDVDVSVPAQMDPRGTYNILITLKNNNDLLLEDIMIKLASNVLTEETTVTVEPNDAKTISFAVLLMDNIKPQADQMQVTVKYGDEEFYSQAHNFEVVEYLLPFRTDVKVNKGFLRQERTITVTNDGNTLKSDSMKLETSLKERLFSSSDPKFNVMKEGGKRYFSWDVSLEPEQSMTIELKTSYRLLIPVAILLIALLIYKAIMSNPLIVKKKSMSVHKHGGAIADMSVVVYLKNRSKEPITNLRVVERVTGMVHLKNDSFSGSMHPVKMHDHHKEGTLLEYRFGELAPGDERIIKYRVYSKLDIFGDVVIKPTVVEFTKKNGAKKKSKSNQIVISTEEPPMPIKQHAPKEHKEHHSHGHSEHHSHTHHKKEE